MLAAGFERLVLITLDATYGAPFSKDQAAELDRLGTPAGTAAAGFIAERVRGYSHLPSMRGRKAAPVHDALAVGYLLDPLVVTLRHVHVAVETTGPLTYGRSVLDLDGTTRQAPNAQWRSSPTPRGSRARPRGAGARLKAVGEQPPACADAAFDYRCWVCG